MATDTVHVVEPADGAGTGTIEEAVPQVCTANPDRGSTVGEEHESAVNGPAADTAARSTKNRSTKKRRKKALVSGIVAVVTGAVTIWVGNSLTSVASPGIQDRTSATSSAGS